MKKRLFDTSGTDPDHTRISDAIALGQAWEFDDLRHMLGNTSEKKPGIYAFYGDDTAWDLVEAMSGALPHGYRDLSRPIYIGIHNHIVGRLLEHLSLCRPDSTYRCSLIALLHEEQSWTTIAPRYRTYVKPTDYRLAPAENNVLNKWIAEHFRVSVWSSTRFIPYTTFGDREHRLIEEFLPPLNVKHSIAPTAFALRRARAICTRIAAVAPHTIRYLNRDDAVLIPRRDIA